MPKAAANPISEATLQHAVTDLCIYLGAMFYHTYRSDRSVPGFPDLVIVTESGRVLWRELKTEKGKLSPAQELWQKVLANAGQNVGVWRPSDWPERIRTELLAD